MLNYNEKLYELIELHNDENIFKYHHCLCGADNDELIETKDKYGLKCNFVICKNCGLIRMNPYYTDDFLEIFYSDFYSPIYRNNKYCSDEIFKNMCNIRGEYIINRIKSSININLRDLKVFEVATGSGGILKAFQNRGAYVYGCDYDEDFISLAKNNNINVIKGDYKVLKRFGKCDILILSHILEHVVEPDIFLNNVSELVSKDGYIYIEIPTLESTAYNLNYTICDFQSAHVYYFMEFNFIELLKRSNLFIVDRYYEYVYGRGAGFLCKKNNFNKNNYNMGYFYVLSFLNNCNYLKNINNNIIKLEFENEKYNNQILKLENINHKLDKIINILAWWIPIKKWRDNFRKKFTC